MSLPLGDWQFWVVTLAALAAAGLLARRVFPRRKGKGRGAQRKVSLTIEGKQPPRA